MRGAVTTTCEETHLVFSHSGSLQQCVMAAPPYIAQWVGEHPEMGMRYAGAVNIRNTNDKADAGSATRPQAESGT